ncbi:hypothetical protein MNAN1_000089 [Malassezia nana]|uniref:NEDD8-activating enzyme E1 regulatory subunit n=1 Tax=Malassezia nana TaxID=180528 RepID=A0AAF0ELX4_9BASI|nr:hypothetical protein MNAN1_000089 [Malassezia nana]
MADGPQDRPNRHTQRYDRQLRLWNHSGQDALEHAHVLVVGASPLAGQVLKDLVLPGLGSFTVCDDAMVSTQDVQHDFFLDGESVGKPYSEALARGLATLNPATTANACDKAPTELLRQDPSFFQTFSLIVCVRQPCKLAQRIAEIAWQASPPIPLVCVRSSGFQGVLHVALGELGIIETHPESLIDLRLTRPFPALQAYAQSYKVDASDSYAQSHVPFVVLLLQALEAWQAAHDGALPSPLSRRAFSEFVRARTPPGVSDTENMDEAVAALAQHVWRPLQSPPVPAGVTALFDDAQCRHLTASSPPFWLLVAALHRFVQGHGTLPLASSLPDMKATSQDYIALQHVYAKQTRADLDAFVLELDAVLADVGTSREALALTDDAVRVFVKHAAFLQLVRGRSLTHQWHSPNTGALEAALMDAVNPVTAQYHLAFVAADRFFEKHGRCAGAYDDRLESDACELLDEAVAYCAEIGLSLTATHHTLLTDACRELARGTGSDTPATAALLGGLVAQEVIKILTVQYLPLDNTCVYDGIVQALSTFRL